MDRQLLERMIGAGVLIAALILIVPIVLDGPRDQDSESVSLSAETGAPADSREPMRTHTMLLDGTPERPPVAREKPIPVTETTTQPGPATETSAVKSASQPPSVVEPDAKKSVVSPATDKQPDPVSTAAQPMLSAGTTRPDAVESPTQDLGPVPTTGWAVQLGSFADKQNAERLATTISASGFSSYLMPLRRSEQTLYRVRVGPRDSRVQATELADRLAKAGFKGQVIEQRPDS